MHFSRAFLFESSLQKISIRKFIIIFNCFRIFRTWYFSSFHHICILCQLQPNLIDWINGLDTSKREKKQKKKNNCLPLFVSMSLCRKKKNNQNQIVIFFYTENKVSENQREMFTSSNNLTINFQEYNEKNVQYSMEMLVCNNMTYGLNL